MRRVFYRAAALLLVAALFTFPSKATPTLYARSHILMDADTGVIFSGKEIHKQSLIASTTKIMTAVVVLESAHLDRVIAVPREAVGVEGSSLYLKEGEQLSVRELLYGLMLHSGNDAAVALALGCSPSVDGFVEKMNRKAEALSLMDTHFENPNGLDGERHYSSAYDLAVLTAYALRLPEFREIVSRKEIHIGNRYLRNHNKLLWMDDGIIGVKTGYTRAAGRILVSAMNYEGRTMIAVTINDGNDWKDHMSLYAYGKIMYSPSVVFQKDEIVGSFPLFDGGEGKLIASENFITWTCPSDRPVICIQYPMIPFGEGGVAVGDVYIGSFYCGRLRLRWEKKYGSTTEGNSLPGTLLTPNG